MNAKQRELRSEDHLLVQVRPNPNPNPNRNRNPDPNTNHSPDPNPDPSQVQPPISPYLEAVLAGRPLPATPPTTQLRVLMTYIAHALTRT